MCVGNNILPFKADMPKEVYEKFKAEADASQSTLLNTIQFFYQEPKTISLLDDYDLKKAYMVQQGYDDVPFCDPTKGDNQTSVATSGCALLVAKFIGEHFRCNNQIDIPEMASLAIALGYRGYKQVEDGSWKKMGMKHVFFDIFVSSFYGLKVSRMNDVHNIKDNLNSGGLSVLLVKNSVYRQDPENGENHFVVIVGNLPASGAFQVYDPEYAHIREVPCKLVVNGILNGWNVAC